MTRGIGLVDDMKLQGSEHLGQFGWCGDRWKPAHVWNKTTMHPDVLENVEATWIYEY
jgi:hypothetical protein